MFGGQSAHANPPNYPQQQAMQQPMQMQTQPMMQAVMMQAPAQQAPIIINNVSPRPEPAKYNPGF